MFKKLKILIVDDAKENQDIMAEYFKELNCDLSFANNGKEAVDKVKRNGFDIFSGERKGIRV